MCKVFSGGENIQELEEKRLTGLKGETVSCQIAYYWGGAQTERGSIAVYSPIKKSYKNPTGRFGTVRISLPYKAGRRIFGNKAWIIPRSIKRCFTMGIFADIWAMAQPLG